MGRRETLLAREEVASAPRHWVRLGTACSNRCIFCLDSDTPRDLLVPPDEVKRDIERGYRERNARRLILSGGEPTVHPDFIEFVRYAGELGYDHVQTVTNGYGFADPEYFEAAMDAGLREITFSLHGHTAELHDRLTGRKGSFRRLVKGLAAALSDGRPIVSVDVVIQKHNVAVVDRVVELAISLGVSEFDLLHPIPQGSAFEQRDEVFYDVADHLPVLRKVFRLNRHPGYTVWTNRFPVSFLEGLEELIQDPHKLLDEVRGRRHLFRNYLDTGEPLACRTPERCVHCFIEPLCTTVDRVLADLHASRWEVWWVGRDGWTESELPYGCSSLGVHVDSPEALASLSLPAGCGVFARVDRPGSPETLAAIADQRPTSLVATRADQLEAWLATEQVELDVALNRETARWLLAHRDRVAGSTERLAVHQPARETVAEVFEHDLPDPRAFFEELGLRLRVRGLVPCLAPNTQLVEDRRVLPRSLFGHETGRPEAAALAEYHIVHRYRARSLRCSSCVVADRCEGPPIQWVRAHGLGALRPLSDGSWAADAQRQLRARWAVPPARLATGRPPEAPVASLPGYPDAVTPPPDPLSLLARSACRATSQQRDEDS